MAFDAAAPLSAIVTLLQGVAGVQHVRTGAPKSLSYQASAYVTLGGFDLGERATGCLSRPLRYFVGLGYATSDDEAAVATAESTIAGWLDDFSRALYADRSLGGTVSSARIVGGLGDDPRYQVYGGEEVRVYPLLIEVMQEQTYTNTGQGG